MNKEKTYRNYRWWVMIVALSPLYIVFFALWVLSGVLGILHDVTSYPLKCKTPNFMVNFFNWVKCKRK